jgi:uncharacterized protein YgiM (DUF1202 family)
MKKMIMFILCLALLSLACLETSSAVIPTAELTEVATRSKTMAMSTAPAMVQITIVTAESVTCATVIADTAQNLRVRADLFSLVLAWLNNGDVVQVIGQSNADWWHVKRGDDIGFARSIFLEVVECVK